MIAIIAFLAISAFAIGQQWMQKMCHLGRGTNAISYFLAISAYEMGQRPDLV